MASDYGCSKCINDKTDKTCEHCGTGTLHDVKVRELVLAHKSVEVLINYIESKGWAWDVGMMGPFLYEARIWDWPNVIGRFRSDKRLTVIEMLERAIEDIDND